MVIVDHLAILLDQADLVEVGLADGVTDKQHQGSEWQVKDIPAVGDIMAVQAQQVKTAHNRARQFMAVVVVAVQAKKVFLVGVGMQTLKAATE